MSCVRRRKAPRYVIRSAPSVVSKRRRSQPLCFDQIEKLSRRPAINLRLAIGVDRLEVVDAFSISSALLAAPRARLRSSRTLASQAPTADSSRTFDFLSACNSSFAQSAVVRKSAIINNFSSFISTRWLGSCREDAPWSTTIPASPVTTSISA